MLAPPPAEDIDLLSTWWQWSYMMSHVLSGAQYLFKTEYPEKTTTDECGRSFLWRSVSNKLHHVTTLSSTSLPLPVFDINTSWSRMTSDMSMTQ
ncbi:hypothetical protein JOB18_001027 [Solea senegalensis]|uniref:Uncharacterized protein n=1 Tax=Solea senegalensis TaxID=28829 RepID=A0AAV6PDV4_SOLSE|nr:hypothetical protein JOB18_001027 [Solea senegalensis]